MSQVAVKGRRLPTKTKHIEPLPYSRAQQALIEATLASVNRYGLCDTSVGRVTELAGLSRGMVRKCFDSKSAMLAAAYKTLRVEWSRHLTQTRQGSAWERMAFRVEAMFTPPAFDPPKLSAWLAFSVAAQHDPALRAVYRETYEIWRAIFEDSVRVYAEEVGLSVDIQAIADTLLALSDGLWLQHMLDPKRITAKRASRITLAVLEKALVRSDSRR